MSALTLPNFCINCLNLDACNRLQLRIRLDFYRCHARLRLLGKVLDGVRYDECGWLALRRLRLGHSFSLVVFFKVCDDAVRLVLKFGGQLWQAHCWLKKLKRLIQSRLLFALEGVNLSFSETRLINKGLVKGNF